MIARIPLHVRRASEGDPVVVTPIPWTELGRVGESVEAVTPQLEAALREKTENLDAIDRIALTAAPHAKLIRVPLRFKRSGEQLEINAGVVLVERQVGGSPVVLAYPVGVTYVEETRRDGDLEKLEERLAKRLEKIMRKWRARHVLAVDDPADSYLTELALELPDGPTETVDADEDTAKEDTFDRIFEELGVELTHEAEVRLDRREELVQRTLEILGSERRSSVLLVGPMDVGKTALVHELAHRIASDDAPPGLQDRRVWRISANELIAGAQYTGMWQDRVRRLIAEARRTRAIIAMGDPVGIIDAGKWSRSDNNASRFLRPYVESGDITIICECTRDQLRAARTKEPSFIEAFNRIDVPEPSVEETLAIAEDTAGRLAASASVTIDPGAIAAAVELTKRFEPYRSFPGKTIRLIEDTVRNRDEDAKVIDRRLVTEAFAQRSGMPLALLSDEIELRIDDVRKHFEERVLGQPGAVSAMVDTITVLKAALNDPNKPLASFFFVGPTGVGKTELAKALAEYLFGSRERVIRLDMGEYSTGEATRRLLGTVWGNEEGELTRSVREQPFCVVLLDEIEKAHWSVFDALLAALGEGRLTDAAGRTADFRNAIVIMTSNLGAARARSGLGFVEGAHDESATYIEAAEKFFRPEFFNRIDGIVVFHALTALVVRQIATRELERLLEREGLRRRGVRVEIDDSAIDAVATAGFHPRYGARPLQREIERAVIAPLSRLLVERRLTTGSFVRIFASGGRISVTAERITVPKAPAARRPRQATVDVAPFTKAERAATLFVKELEEDPASRFADELRPTISALVELTHDPAFWDDQERARASLQRIYALERVVDRFDALRDRAWGLATMARRVREARDRARVAEVGRATNEMHDELLVVRLELAAAASGATDDMAVIRISPVGTNADGWARQLWAMYEAWATRTGREAAVVGLDGGRRLEIAGFAAFELLAGETGLHRHVRPDRTEAVARVVVARTSDADGALEDAGLVVRVYEEGKRRIVRDPRTGARVTHVAAVLEDGHLDPFLLASLRAARE
jgi:ATP-dependent Clp protease ATP-binding subunit ClpA